MRRQNARTIVCLTFLFVLFCSCFSFAYAEENGTAPQVKQPVQEKVLKGWVRNGDHRYYYIDGKRYKGIKIIDGYRYYFDTYGVMRTGARKFQGQMYYFRESGKGVMDKGWFHGPDGKKRYCFGKARIAFGDVKIGTVWHRFSKNDGSYVRRLGDDIDINVANKYSSQTKYLVILKLKEHKVRIYEGSKGKWKRTHIFKCTVGRNSTPTPTGVYTIKSRGKFFNTGSWKRCWYYTQFFGNYLFHSVIYDRKPSPVNVVDGRLGINASHGCVRMSLKNAIWFYWHIPRGTKVVIY